MLNIRRFTRTLSSSSNGARLYSWGKNETGELGRDSEKLTGMLPALVEDFPQPGQNVIAVSAGTRHALACTNDGSVYAWGSNKFHVLGNSAREEDKVTKPI